MQVLKSHRKCTSRIKLKTVTISVIVSSLILLVYQVVIVFKITDRTQDLLEAEHFKTKQTKTNHSGSDPLQSDTSIARIQIVGALKNDKKYIPNISGKILCVMDFVEVDISKVNDDYCDCPADGMDEPGTNACKNGRFFCNHQSDPKNFPKYIPSSQVNDGICDCCDGSDEWNGFLLPNRLTDEIQRRLNRFQSPCSYHC